MTGRGSIAGWKQALLLALAFHAAFFILLFFSPGLWHKKVRMPPVYNVQLFAPPQTMKAATGPKVKVQQKKSVKKKAIKAKPKAVKTVSRKKAAKKVVKRTKTPAKTPSKAVSLKPRKTVKKKTGKRPEKTKVARVKQKKQVRKKVNEEKELSRRIRKIQEKVREKEEEQALRQRLASLKKKVQSGSGSSAAGAAGARGERVNDALRRYAGTIWMHVRKNWHFPEELLKRKDLEAIVSIRVDRKGHIMSRQFEKRSGFPAFDRSVLKAVSDSDPLPPLPPQLMPGPIEIGIRFNPSRMNSP